MKSKYRLAFLFVCLSIAIMLMFGQVNAQEQKKQWANGDDIQWNDAGANGSGTSIKMLLTKDNGMIDDLIRGIWNSCWERLPGRAQRDHRRRQDDLQRRGAVPGQRGQGDVGAPGVEVRSS